MSDAPRMMHTIKPIVLGAAVFLVGGALHGAAVAAGMPHDLVPWLGLIVCAACFVFSLAMQHSHPGHARLLVFIGVWVALGALAGVAVL